MGRSTSVFRLGLKSPDLDELMRRQWMTALPGGHVEVAVLFAPRRDREALGRAGRRPLHTRHVGVAGELLGRHVEERCEHRHRRAEGGA